jgi:diketogulonate reductase-like aldo/keto reductase
VTEHRGVREIAKRHGKTTAQIVFRFAQQIGMLPLTGTTSSEHMRQDLAIADFALAPDELAVIEGAG